jgi:hypothetical protein
LSNVAVGKISGGRGLARLTCTLQIDPPERDIVVERRMLEGDVEALGSLLERSNLYGGGHTGLDNSASEGPWELLQVRCCGRTDMIVLVTQGTQRLRMALAVNSWTFSTVGPATWPTRDSRLLS